MFCMRCVCNIFVYDCGKCTRNVWTCAHENSRQSCASARLFARMKAPHTATRPEIGGDNSSRNVSQQRSSSSGSVARAASPPIDAALMCLLSLRVWCVCHIVAVAFLPRAVSLPGVKALDAELELLLMMLLFLLLPLPLTMTSAASMFCRRRQRR